MIEKHSNYDICSQKHLFSSHLALIQKAAYYHISFFPVCYHKRMIGGGLNIRFPYHLLYHFIFVIMLSVVKYSFTLERIARAVFLCNNVLDIHKIE